MFVRNYSFLFFVFFLIISKTTAQDSFEGSLKFKVSADGESGVMQYFIKGENFRMELISENGVTGEKVVSMNIDGQTIMLIPSEKTYMVMGRSNNNGNNFDNSSLTNKEIEKYKTGKEDIILGKKCIQLVFEDEMEGVFEIWITKEYADLNLTQTTFSGDLLGWESMFGGLNYFPLLIISRDFEGAETGRFEVLEIKKKKLDDDLFKIPDGFRKMEF